LSLTLPSWITPTGHWLLRKNGPRRDWDSSDLPRSLISLVEVKEGVGEVDDVLMAVDVGHGAKNMRVEEWKSIDRRRWRQPRPNHKPYISSTSL